MKEIKDNEIKKITLEILDEFHKFCIANNLKYTLFYGSLLGAIRHKGFIPWDDDVDVAMPREDYDYFVKNFKSDNYDVYYAKTKYFFLPSAKLFDKRTRKIEGIKLNKKFNIGMDIDIFPLDYVDSIKHYDVIQKKKRIWMRVKVAAFYPIWQNNKFSVKLISYLLRPFGNFAVKKIDKLGQKYNNKKRRFYIANPMFGKEKLIFNIHLFDKLDLKPFENLSLYVTSLYDEVLKQRYGNYLELPPIDEQIAHHNFKAFYLDNN